MMWLLRLFLVVTMACAPAPSALAQAAAAPKASDKPTAVADAFGRDTPRGAVTGLIQALADRNYVLASNFFETSGPSDQRGQARAAELARQFHAALDAGGSLLPFGILSNDAGGRIDDGLALNLEQVGSFGKDGATPIMLSRSADPAAPVWRVSADTIRTLQSRAPTASTPSAKDPAGPMVAGAPLADWAKLIGAVAATFGVFWLISAVILAALRAVIKGREQSPLYRFTEAALPPLSLFLAVVFFQLSADKIDASIVARQTLLRYIGIVAWVAFAWLALRLIDAVAHVTTARMQRRERRQAVSVIILARRTAKVLLLALAFVAILDTLGFDVSTGLAALGIGGLALALGAQKTIENLVGSVTLIVDRPVQVGDFCRVGDIVGTVEDIGIRSTRIRTSERTLVTIPNGNFASQQIENFDKRDRFLFNPTIRVEFGVDATTLGEGVRIIEQVLLETDQVDKSSARARLGAIGAAAFEIEVFAYITTADFVASLAVRQELLLKIYEQIEAAGLTISAPARSVQLAAPSRADDLPPSKPDAKAP